MAILTAGEEVINQRERLRSGLAGSVLNKRKTAKTSGFSGGKNPAALGSSRSRKKKTARQTGAPGRTVGFFDCKRKRKNKAQVFRRLGEVLVVASS